jgi:hypothetical protein
MENKQPKTSTPTLPSYSVKVELRAMSKRHVMITIKAFEGETNLVNREQLLPSHMLYERVEEAVGTVWRQVCQDLLKRLEDVPL